MQHNTVLSPSKGVFQLESVLTSSKSSDDDPISLLSLSFSLYTFDINDDDTKKKRLARLLFDIVETAMAKKIPFCLA